jgi:hypothetical protein
MGKKSIRAIAFILRCSGAATVGYELASALGLHEALCDAMSAVIVSEEDLHETRSSLLGRIFGTLLGIGITVGVSEVASRLAASTTLQMVVAVGISALIVRWRASSLIQFAWYPRSASNIILKQCAEKNRTQPIVVRLTRREGEMYRQAIGIDHRMKLACQASSRATHILLIVIAD